MRRRQALVATSHEDAHGERIPPEELEKLAARYSGFLVPSHVEHDYSKPPVGRAVDATVRSLEDDHLGLYATFEFWDENDSSGELAREGRLVSFEVDADRFEIAYGRLYLELGKSEFIQDLVSLGGQDEPRYFSQKAIDAGAILLISAVFVGSHIASGFLSELGADIYKALKEKLKGKFEEGDYGQLVFRFRMESGDEPVQVLLLLDSPEGEELEQLFSSGFSEVDSLVKSELRRRPTARRVVVSWDRRGAEALYSLDDNAVPEPREVVADETLENAGWSIGGSSSLGVNHRDE